MKLYEDGLIALDAGLSRYLPELAGTNKAGLTLNQIMTHRSGLKAWIPFYERTLTAGKQRDAAFYSTAATEGFNLQVGEDLFLRDDYQDTIWLMILDSELRPNQNYLYSDLGFYIIARLVKTLSGLQMDEYVERNFYRPLGMNRTSFNASKRYRKDEIVPTEEDEYWRNGTVHGFVHDMGAAMLNGVSGHAGLFSTAEDLVKIYQMLLNEGHYGGKQYLRKETVRHFTQRAMGSSRRAIGFDMKELNASGAKNIGQYASARSYGHFGFTGTCVWVDPEYQLIYVFLSNRTYPSMKNNLLHREDYRSRIQEAVYRSFLPNLPSQS